MTDTSDQQTPLAGARCPKCDEVCVYEISDALARSQVEAIQIACHACSHIFKTAIPDDVRLPSVETPELSVESQHDIHHQITDIQPDIDDEAPMAFNDTEETNRSWIKYLGISAACIVVLLIGIVTVNSLSTPSGKVELAAVDDSLAAVPMPQSEETPVEKTKPTVTTEETQPVITDQSGSNATPTQFNVSDRGYTISKTDLGTVMNIKVSVINNGDSPAIPEKILIHLLSNEGVILMSWPMINASASNRNLIPPRSSRLYSAQLIEPPEGAKTLEVEIQ